MENTNAQPETQPAAAPEQPKQIVKKKEEPFSLQWHLKVLAIIYACLAVLYILVKIFLK